MTTLATQDNTDRALVLEQAARGELVTTLSRKQVLELETDLIRIVKDAEETYARLREMTGPEQHGLAAHLSFMLRYGTGCIRHARDVLRALRRAGRKGAV